MLTKREIELYRKIQKDPFEYAKAMFGLLPQPIKEEYRARWEQGLRKDWEAWESFKLSVNDQWFEPFVKGKHLTWQQTLLFWCVKKALARKASNQISVVSGHGTGKSASIAILILWYLFSYKDCQVPCTAPSADQMYDVLWKEVATWHARLPAQVKDLYDVESSYVRIKESPKTWFARAKTARKENPEALAGIHADYVMMLVDEASGVHESIFTTAQGALTNENVLFIMISNGTRLQGFFYDSHHRLKDDWQRLSFDSEASPIVDNDYVERITKKYGADSDEYRVRVRGKFPKADAIDQHGYSPLLLEKDLERAFTTLPKQALIGSPRLSVDVAGEGNNFNVWILRYDNFARVLDKVPVLDTMETASVTARFATEHDIHPYNVFVDKNGVGRGVVDALHNMNFFVRGVLASASPDIGEDKETFLNRRAQNFWRMRMWLMGGGKLDSEHADDWREILSIKYKTMDHKRLQIMPKLMMQREGISSPDVADALAQSFDVLHAHDPNVTSDLVEDPFDPNALI